jgi:hypothetical protein
MVNWTRFDGSAVEWDTCLGAIAGGNFYQSYAWGSYRAALGWQALRLVARSEGAVIAMAQVLVKRKASCAVCWIPGGPAGAVAEWAPTLPAALRAELGRLTYCRLNALNEAAPGATELIGSTGWKRPGVRLGSGLSLDLDLRPEAAIRLASTSGNWRHNLKRAGKYGLLVERWAEPDAGQIASVYREMEGIKNLPEQHSHAALDAIIAHLGNRLIVYRCLDADGQLLAIRAGAVFAGRGWDLLATANQAARKVYASHALLWALAEECRRCGAGSFDLGGADPDGNKGVFNFKQGTGARLFEYVGEWEWAGVPGLATAAGILIKRKGLAG